MTDGFRDQLVLHEGLRLTVYDDSLGIPTIGVGRNLRDKGITREEAFYLLNNDVAECDADLATFPWWAGLDPVRRRVLCDLRFNLGPSRFRDFKRLNRALTEGNWPLAVTSLRESLWAKQVKTRADRLIRMMQTGELPPELKE